jgi:extradiol dioxygenase family protein
MRLTTSGRICALIDREGEGYSQERNSTERDDLGTQSHMNAKDNDQWYFSRGSGISITGGSNSVCPKNPADMSSTSLQIAVQVRDEAEARWFYREMVGCSEEATEKDHLEFRLSRYKIQCLLNPKLGDRGKVATRYELAGGKFVQLPHNSVLLKDREWNALAVRLKGRRINFTLKRSDYLKDSLDEHAAFLFEDPSGNLLEIRSFHAAAAGPSWRKRSRALLSWSISAIVALSVLCWVQREMQKSGGNFGAQVYYAPMRILH